MLCGDWLVIHEVKYGSRSGALGHRSPYDAMEALGLRNMFAEGEDAVVVHGTVRRMFAGSNTARGYCSFYDRMIPRGAERVLILKGGPGVGKSTLIRSVAVELTGQGIDAELWHCSSAGDSLDGACFPALGTVILDGTSPHALEPDLPGVVEEVIYLNDFMDSAAITDYRQELLTLQEKKQLMYMRAYRFLEAADIIYRDWREIMIQRWGHGCLNLLLATTVKRLFGERPVSGQPGQSRHIFARAITADGIIDHSPALVSEMKRKITLYGQPGSGKSALLGKIAEAAAERGLDTEIGHCPLNPDRLELLLIPQLNLAIQNTDRRPAPDPISKEQVIDVKGCSKPLSAEEYRGLTRANRSLVMELLERAVSYLSAARHIHGQMEKRYIEAMDFAALDDLGRQVTQTILHQRSQRI